MRKALNLSGGKLDKTEPNVNDMGMYGAVLLKSGKSHTPVYGGTVPFNVIQKRRAKAKRAKQSRKANRG
jgi:hypothetical protein